MGHYTKLKWLVTGFHEIAVLKILQISWILCGGVHICCLQLPEEVLHNGCFSLECYKTF